MTSLEPFSHVLRLELLWSSQMVHMNLAWTAVPLDRCVLFHWSSCSRWVCKTFGCILSSDLISTWSKGSKRHLIGQVDDGGPRVVETFS